MSDLISRQAAIEVLRNRWLKTRNYEGIGEDIAEECEIYLKTLPSAQPVKRTEERAETHACDLISRQKAVVHLEKRLIETAINNIGMIAPCDRIFEDIADNRIGPWLNELTSAQPERKRGKWEIYVISMFDGEGCRCSECGFEGVPYWDYCPNCGAKMEVDDGSD